MSDSAYLELIIGPMYASKTSRLVEIYNQCKFCNISISVINHSIDNRYDDLLLSTHDKIKIPCIKTQTLTDIWIGSKNIKRIDDEIERITQELPVSEIQNIKDKLVVFKSEVILINEGQFFEDLYEVVIDMLKYGKKVYVCGLDGDFERKKFGAILDLIPLCDKVTKLNSLCSLCKDGTHGIFSMRLTNETEQTLVGSDNYIPVCRKCYEKKHV